MSFSHSASSGVIVKVDPKRWSLRCGSVCSADIHEVDVVIFADHDGRWVDGSVNRNSANRNAAEFKSNDGHVIRIQTRCESKAACVLEELFGLGSHQ